MHIFIRQRIRNYSISLREKNIIKILKIHLSFFHLNKCDVFFISHEYRLFLAALVTDLEDIEYWGPKERSRAFRGQKPEGETTKEKRKEKKRRRRRRRRRRKTKKMNYSSGYGGKKDNIVHFYYVVLFHSFIIFYSLLLRTRLIETSRRGQWQGAQESPRTCCSLHYKEVSLVQTP